MKYIKIKGSFIKESIIASIDIGPEVIVVNYLNNTRPDAFNFSNAAEYKREVDNIRKTLTKDYGLFIPGIAQGISFTVGLVIGLTVTYLFLKVFLN